MSDKVQAIGDALTLARDDDIKPLIAFAVIMLGLTGLAFYGAADAMAFNSMIDNNRVADIRNAGLLVQAARGGPFPDKYDMLDAEVERFVHHMSRNSTTTLHTVIMRVVVGDEAGHVGMALFSGARIESGCVDAGRGASWPCGGPPLAYHHDIYAVDCGGTEALVVEPGDVVTLGGCFALPAHMSADAVALVGNDAVWYSFGNQTYSPHRVMLVDLAAGSPVPHLSCERTGDSVVCE